jgi:serine/threonine protein kinase
VLKLCDFGFAIRCADTRLKERIGTLIYKAPELCSVNARGNGYLGRPVDMWAFGAVMYEMLHNRHAFTGNTKEDIEVRISSPGGFNDLRRSMSPAAKSLVLSMLQQEPKQRLTADEVLAHGWLQRAPIAPSQALPLPSGHGGEDGVAEDEGSAPLTADGDDDEEEADEHDDDEHDDDEGEAEREEEWRSKFKALNLDRETEEKLIARHQAAAHDQSAALVRPTERPAAPPGPAPAAIEGQVDTPLGTGAVVAAGAVEVA